MPAPRYRGGLTVADTITARTWTAQSPLHPLNVLANNIIGELRALYAGPGSMEKVWAAIRAYETSEANTDPKGLARWIAKVESPDCDADTFIGLERFVNRTNLVRLRALRAVA